MVTDNNIKFGLIGYSLSHSFSKKYFTKKFRLEKLPYVYELIELQTLSTLPESLKNFPKLQGFNVTIPYKQGILQYLDEIDEDAKVAGAVNTVKISPDGKLKGYNTDIIGFKMSFLDFLAENGRSTDEIENALILGTGGASNAVEVVLTKLGITSIKVSRKPKENQLSYEDLSKAVIQTNQLIINASPIGTHPKSAESPKIPYEHITNKHILFDLVYNPEKTVFLDKGSRQGAITKNGLDMLYLQADAAWKIWNDMDLKSTEKQEGTDFKAINFKNTEIAFQAKSDKQLKKAKNLFAMMNKAWLVNTTSPLGLFAVKYKLPFAKSIIKATIFEQFVGGTSFDEVQQTVKKLWQYKTQSILDYGVEAKDSEEDFEKTKIENIKAVKFAAANLSVPVVSTKVTGLGRFELLENFDPSLPASLTYQEEFDKIHSRLQEICAVAEKEGTSVFIDAEESWIQNAIDHLTDLMMKKFNGKRPVVFNTFQMYRHDRLEFLKTSFNKARAENYILGAKLVRGAYMGKERDRAEEKGYTSPIHLNKKAVDQDYDDAIRYCMDHIDLIACCVASHNEKSTQLFAKLIHNKKIANDHPHVNFCQLYGMSDHLTFNLAAAGYNVAKYVPYGPVADVIPYLIRRAQENSSVTGDMSREHRMITEEVLRRKGK